jgi:hypothetical protein
VSIFHIHVAEFPQFCIENVTKALSVALQMAFEEFNLHHLR